MEKLDLEYFEKVESNEKLHNILKYSRENFIPTMLTHTGKLLYRYVSKLKPKSILEIGTAIGYSGIVMLIASDTMSHITTIEKNEERVILAKNNFKECNLSDNVDVLQGDASEIINDIHYQIINKNNKIANNNTCNNEIKSCTENKIDMNEIKSQKYDFIFLDGSKSQYIKQIDMLLDILNDNGVIFIDDALYMYSVYKEGDVPHKHRAMIKNLRNFVVKILDNEDIGKEIFNYDEGIIIVTKQSKLHK